MDENLLMDDGILTAVL